MHRLRIVNLELAQMMNGYRTTVLIHSGPPQDIQDVTTGAGAALVKTTNDGATFCGVPGPDC
jgi:hypothetical protein